MCAQFRQSNKKTTFLNTLCDMYAIYFLKKRQHFHGWCESKPDIDVCTASGYFKVLRSLVTSTLPFLYKKKLLDFRGEEKMQGGSLSNPFKGFLLFWHMDSSQEERRDFFNCVIFQEQEIHRKTFPFVLRQSQHHKTQGLILRKSSIDLCMLASIPCHIVYLKHTYP